MIAIRVIGLVTHRRYHRISNMFSDSRRPNSEIGAYLNYDEGCIRTSLDISLI